MHAKLLHEDTIRECGAASFGPTSLDNLSAASLAVQSPNSQIYDSATEILRHGG